MMSPESVNLRVDMELDVRGLHCPMPLLKTRQSLRPMVPGQVLLVRATDAGSWRDIPAYVGQSGHKLVHRQQLDNEYRFWIEAGEQLHA